ncbi:hypothetical protein [Nocardia sputi]|uniref:hypothetical protein n=1 Tax=Nocardia sputi TaxID=2943705 RepID=UPI0020BE10B6|nr:hypothetical protein [Nocardia sputi]
MEEKDIHHYLEMWKKTVEVQQHFNDLEWRIRGLAMTVLTFAFGAAAVAAKDGTAVKVFGFSLQLSCIVLVLGFVLWLAFYFVDKVWYHQLLTGAVKHGDELEQELRTQLPHAGLTGQIGRSSPQVIKIFFWSKELHSTGKLRLFYAIGAAALLSRPSPSSSDRLRQPSPNEPKQPLRWPVATRSASRNYERPAMPTVQSPVEHKAQQFEKRPTEAQNGPPGR